MSASRKAEAVADPSIRRRVVAPLGRPRKQEQVDKIVHDALLFAADECLVTESTTRVPVRQIAAKAGVNQAMVNYYFSSKGGLLLALFERQFSRLIRDLKAFQKDISKNIDRDRNYIEELLAIIDQDFASSPALFVMMHTDMLDSSSETIQAYHDRFGSRGYNVITQIVEILMQQGVCRNDISPDHAAYFICCVSAMPFLLSPIFERAFAGKSEGNMPSERWRAVTRMLSPCDRQDTDPKG